MRKRKPTTLAVLASVLMAALALGGCSKQKDASGTVEVEFWHGLGGELGTNVQTIVDGFNASQTRYHVQTVTLGSYSEIDEKLQAAYAAGNPPALVAGGSADSFYAKKLVEPFEKYMPKSYDKSDIVKGFLDAATRDGRMVFAPAYGTSQVVYYNKAAAKKSGLKESDLSSWQNLAAAAPRIVGFDAGKNRIKYVWEPMWGSGNIADMASSAGGRYLSADGKTVTINSPEWVEVCEQVRVWLHDDKIMAIHSGGQGWEYWYKTMDDWVYGLSLGYTGSPGDYAIALKAVRKSAEDGCDIEFAAAPQPGWKGRDPAPYFSSLMFFIPKSKGLSEAQKKGAGEFVAYMTSALNTARFSMATGYVAVRKSVLDLPEYKKYLASNPDADAALRQIDKYAVPAFRDPTGGAIGSALSEAVDKIEIEGKPVREALDDAAAKAQRELDKVLKARGDD